ncbi:MAG: SDR family oxidoreductase [Oscillatoria sp. SIO1A7]|nr:SDR family oxidoreductase [Oscillatoria sp. SIO1A7]
MKTVVITGSSRGIGLGLADAFLKSGCAVAINGRTDASLETVLAALSAKYSPERVLAVKGDVAEFEQMQDLWNKAKQSFGRVDIWINNAGITQPRVPVWQMTPEQIEAIIDINLTGAIYGAKAAIPGMLEQGFGAIYNMEGSGSDGGKIINLALYGTSKCAIRFLTESLVLETKGMPIIVGALSPGMVVTDLLVGQYERDSQDWQRVKRIFNILADRVETVTPWLAVRVLANQTHGARIAWLTKSKALARFIAAPFSKRDLFATSKD